MLYLPFSSSFGNIVPYSSLFVLISKVYVENPLGYPLIVIVFLLISKRKESQFKKRGQSSSLFKARCFECNSTDHLVADCSKAIEKEKGALEAILEALKKKKKVKGLIGAWDQDLSESEGEEKANLCFMVVENEITKKNKELKNKIDNLSNENSKLICENKSLLKSLEVVKKESDSSSKLEFQKLTLENKDLCEKVFSFEKCMADYDDLKKKRKNANVGHGEASESSRGGKKGKRKQAARSETPFDKFISVQAATNDEDWTQKKRKIAPGHRVNLSDMGDMEIIPALFHDIGVELNLVWNVIISRVNGKNIVFDDKLLNSILETLEDGMCFYTKNKKYFDPNLYSEKRFEEIFTKGIVLKRSEDRTVAKLDNYGRILHHVISNIVIPNVRHKSSITNMHSFVMLAMHEHRKVNFGYIAIEHMLATQSSSTKCLPYGYFITKIFQHFEINLVGVGDHIGPGKIYNQNTFKRMGFERNDEGLFIRGGQQGCDHDDEEDNGDEEKDNEPESMDDEEEDIEEK
ncbi:hypothetical protein M9H77_30558 [Catharanthus roseus]|uniref:Uncharacterized protein n=1 Tax=Catharanthus roseus TaxID=4058 RepID=A0ACC0A1H9_CATRO|nr:hypothetical protein M9H77_30558 [Catharanthus roseus]